MGDIADYLDFQSGKIVRNIKEHTFEGTETWSGGFIDTTGWGGTNTVGLYQYFDGTNHQTIFGEDLPKSNSNTLNNYFTKRAGYNTDRTASGMSVNYYYMRIDREVLMPYGGDNSSNISNQRAFAAWVRSRYEHNEPVKVLYQLQTPVEENITLPEFSTYEDYNKIEVLTDTVPSKIEVTYTGYTLD